MLKWLKSVAKGWGSSSLGALNATKLFSEYSHESSLEEGGSSVLPLPSMVKHNEGEVVDSQATKIEETNAKHEELKNGGDGNVNSIIGKQRARLMIL